MAHTLILDQSRQALAGRMSDARARTDELFSILQPGALYDRPIPERHRLIFYLGHVEAFDWNLIARRAFGIEPFNAQFDKLFAFGIDPIGGGLPNEPPSDWPEAAQVRSYGQRVRAIVDKCLAGGHTPLETTDIDTTFNMAIEHRLMHAETLAYLFHQLPLHAKIPAAGAPVPVTPGAPRLREIQIPEGSATLGRSREEPGFGWDNEFERLRIHVPSFSIDSHKVTNGRFLEFVRDGGYAKRELWADAAWEWKSRESIRHPQFWLERDGAWLYRGMFAEVPSGRALPTEPQFHRAAYGTPDGSEREYPWGAAPPADEHGNFDLRRWDPTPIGAFPAGDSAFAVSELVGNGWEWTSSVFGPFPGFHPHPDYEGYSANFFDGEHFVQKGGSPRTAACMLRRSFRNWFQPHYRYVYAGFRTAGPRV